MNPVPVSSAPNAISSWFQNSLLRVKASLGNAYQYICTSIQSIKNKFRDVFAKKPSEYTPLDIKTNNVFNNTLKPVEPVKMNSTEGTADQDSGEIDVSDQECLIPNEAEVSNPTPSNIYYDVDIPDFREVELDRNDLNKTVDAACEGNPIFSTEERQLISHNFGIQQPAEDLSNFEIDATSIGDWLNTENVQQVWSPLTPQPSDEHNIQSPAPRNAESPLPSSPEKENEEADGLSNNPVPSSLTQPAPPSDPRAVLTERIKGIRANDSITSLRGRILKRIKEQGGNEKLLEMMDNNVIKTLVNNKKISPNIVDYTLETIIWKTYITESAGYEITTDIVKEPETVVEDVEETTRMFVQTAFIPSQEIATTAPKLIPKNLSYFHKNVTNMKGEIEGVERLNTTKFKIGLTKETETKHNIYGMDVSIKANKEIKGVIDNMYGAITFDEGCIVGKCTFKNVVTVEAELRSLTYISSSEDTPDQLRVVVVPSKAAIDAIKKALRFSFFIPNDVKAELQKIVKTGQIEQIWTAEQFQKTFGDLQWPAD
jgi:hypothetical protein